LTFQLVLKFTSVREGTKVAGPALTDAVLKYVDTILHMAALRDGCGGRIRTYDLQVMSLTSYQAAPPRGRLWKVRDCACGARTIRRICLAARVDPTITTPRISVKFESIDLSIDETERSALIGEDQRRRTKGYASSLLATLQQTSNRLPQGSSKKIA
jgi:hypothetical protein